MSDDLSIPSPRYHTPHQRGGLDPALRRLMVYAGGLVAVGVVIGGVSLLFNRQGAGPVPVVQADPRPLRVKPENPGGMQIAGLRSDRTGEAEQPGKLAPEPEIPDPNMLRTDQSASTVEAPDPGALRAAPAAPAKALTDATLKASTDATAKAPAEAPAAPASRSVTPAASAPQARQSVPPTPTPVPAAVASTPLRTTTPLVQAQGARPVPAPTPVVQQVSAGVLMPPKAAAAPVARPVSVQLAALATEEAARAEWQQMERRMPDVLGTRAPGFSKFEREGRTYWRVRVSGFGDVQQAKSFCERVRAKSASCSVADF